MKHRKSPHAVAVEIADQFFPRDSAMYRRLVAAIEQLVRREREHK